MRHVGLRPASILGQSRLPFTKPCLKILKNTKNEKDSSVNPTTLSSTATCSCPERLKC